MLTSFGSPKVKALENSDDNCQEEVLDIQKPKQFDLKDCPYIFMRLTESIRIFNVDLASNSKYKLTTLVNASLAPLPFQYPVGSILSLHVNVE